MKEQIISFETAKLAKEKGFDIDASHFYVKHHKCKVFGIDEYGRYYPSTNTPKKLYTIGQDAVLSIENVYFAPTQSLLQKWLRGEYNTNIWISCTPYLNSYTFNYNLNKEIITDVIKYVNYEEALEKGLQKSLKLIIND
jgi:hypothetical protein